LGLYKEQNHRYVAKMQDLCRDPSILQGMEDRMFESIELWEEYREEEQKWMEK